MKPCYCEALQAGRIFLEDELAECLRDEGGHRALPLEDVSSGREQAAQGARFELVYSASLLTTMLKGDARSLIRRAMEMLGPGGRLVVGNLAAGAGARRCDKCAALSVTRRSLEDLIALAERSAEADLAGRLVYWDGSGLNVFLELHKSMLPERSVRRGGTARAVLSQQEHQR